jgi:hypothetical protein
MMTRVIKSAAKAPADSGINAAEMRQPGGPPARIKHLTPAVRQPIARTEKIRIAKRH